MAKNPNFMNAKDTQLVPDYQKEEACKINVNMRCQTIDITKKRGTVMFVGKVAGLGAGYWIGIKLDSKEGNSKGTVDGI